MESVTQEINRLTKTELRDHLKRRNDTIEIELDHLRKQHDNEITALHKRLTSGWDDQDRLRKRQQSKLFQKFTNNGNSMHVNQRRELANLNHLLNTKNYATTIVGKNRGAMRRDQYKLKWEAWYEEYRVKLSSFHFLNFADLFEIVGASVSRSQTSHDDNESSRNLYQQARSIQDKRQPTDT